MILNDIFFKIIEISKRHYIACVLAFAIGFLTIAPNLLFVNTLGDDYKGLYIMKADAHPYYIARIKEIYDGNGMANPYIYEYKFDVLSATPIFSAYPTAIAGKILGVKAEKIALASTFIIPALVALFVYSFGYLLTRKRFYAFTLGTLIMFGTILFNIPDLLHLLSGELVYTQFTIWTRPVLPAMSFLIFFLYLNVLYKSIETGEKRWLVLSVIAYGLSFYTYLYCFLFITTLNLVLSLIFLIKRNWMLLKKIVWIGVGGVLIGSYAIYYLYKVTQSPYYDFLAKSLGLIQTRGMILSTGMLISTIVFGLFLFYKKELNEKNIFILALLVSTFIVVNQQMITGKILQEGHFHWYFNVPVFAIVLVYVLSNINKPVFFKIIATLIISFSVYASFFVQYSSYRYWFADIKDKQRYMEVFLWLNNNTKKEEVVLSNEDISQYIPVFTLNNVVYDVQAYNFLWSKDRADFRPETIIGPNLEEKIKKYRVDYVVFDKEIDFRWNLSQYDFLEEKYSENSLMIFEILPK